MPVPGEVRGGLAGAGGGVQVGGDAGSRLRGAQVATVLRLTEGDVTCGEVGQPRRPRQRRIGAGGGGGPEVLADLDGEGEVLGVRGGEDQVVGEGYPLPEEEDLPA